MSTNWDGTFKKLFEEVSDSWLMLPIHIRGIGCECLRVSQRVSGKLGDTRDTLPLLRKLGCDRSESAMVEEAVTALLEQGFLSIGPDGGLYITNLAASQEDQRAKWREKKNNQRSKSVPVSPQVSPDVPGDKKECTPVQSCHQLSPREERRSEGDEMRGDDDGTHAREPVGTPDVNRETSIPMTWSPSLAAVSDLAKHFEVPPAAIASLAKEFLDYWAVGGGMGHKRANWQAKFREHIRKTLSNPSRLAEVRAEFSAPPIRTKVDPELQRRAAAAEAESRRRAALTPTEREIEDLRKQVSKTEAALTQSLPDDIARPMRGDLARAQRRLAALTSTLEAQPSA